jgi:hypothetical protein
LIKALEFIFGHLSHSLSAPADEIIDLFVFAKTSPVRGPIQILNFCSISIFPRIFSTIHLAVGRQVSLVFVALIIISTTSAYFQMHHIDFGLEYLANK